MSQRILYMKCNVITPLDIQYVYFLSPSLQFHLTISKWVKENSNRIHTTEKPVFGRRKVKKNTDFTCSCVFLMVANHFCAAHEHCSNQSLVWTPGISVSIPDNIYHFACFAGRWYCTASQRNDPNVRMCLFWERCHQRQSNIACNWIVYLSPCLQTHFVHVIYFACAILFTVTMAKLPTNSSHCMSCNLFCVQIKLSFAKIHNRKIEW